MPVPKQHASRKRTGDRRKHLALKPLFLAVCSHCKASILPHRACPECGYYRGKSVIVMEKPQKRQETRDKASKGKTKRKEDEEDTGKPLNVETLSKK